MQPNEGASLSLSAKIPGTKMRIRPVQMEFLYGTAFMSQSPEAYERLIIDAMRGDATLFTRNDEVEAQWKIIDPILEAWHEDDSEPLPQYEAGLAGAGGSGADPARRRQLAEHLGRDVRRGLVRARHDAVGDRRGAARDAHRTTTPRRTRTRRRAC